MLTDEITVTRRIDGAVDRLGNATDSFTDPETVNARIEQIGSLEIAVGEDVIVANYRVFLMPAVALGPLDRIEDVSGRKFEVVGQPDLLSTPRGPHHIEANLRTVLSG